MNNYNKILVIEDNLGDFVLIEDYLLEKFQTSRVFHCDGFTNAIDFIKIHTDIAVILLDIHLPDYHGNSLVEDVKKISHNTPIIILTGYADENKAQHCLTVGASDFLLKDEINPEILYKSITYASERTSFIETLENEKTNYQRLFSLSPQPLILFDKNNLKFLNVNKAATEKYGYSEEEFLHMSLWDLIPKNELEHFENQRLQYQHLTEIHYPELFRHVTKKGKIIDVEIFRKDIEYDGKIAGLKLMNDVTEKQKHLKTIERQNDKLKKIAWNQSHVVRAPLSRILGIVNLLEIEKLNTEETNFFLNELKNSANELDEIVRKIVDETKTIN
jgi:PAS domain S-box-containing protein